MKKQDALKTLVVGLCLSLTALSAFGEGFPKTPVGLGSKSAAELAALPDVKVRLGVALTAADFANKTETELSLMRNSIVAQVGFPFSEAWLKNYFASRKWYKAGKFDSKSLSPVDFANAVAIKKYQKEHGLLTVIAASKTPRAIASTDTPSKLSGKALNDRILKMRYCDLYSDGEYVYTIKFHRKGSVTTSVGESGAHGSSYGYAESGANDGSYENGYDSGGGRKLKGRWALAPDEQHINITLDVTNTPFALYFGTKSYHAHACFMDVSEIP